MKTLSGDFDYDYNPAESYSPTMGEADFPMYPDVVESDPMLEDSAMIDPLATVESVAQAQIDKGVQALQSTGITSEAEKYGIKLTKERIMLFATAYVMFRMMKNKWVWLGLIGAGAYMVNKKQGEQAQVVAQKAPVVSVDPSTHPKVEVGGGAVNPMIANELSGWI